MSILDIFKKTPPKTSKVNTKVEQQPIEKSKETDKALTDARHGVIGGKTGGYDNKKPYSNSIKK
ncbi:MAG: hypothetical protein RLZZ196_1328 [Bacteroidota bacterium]|jgi:hypothetical protein